MKLLWDYVGGGKDLTWLSLRWTESSASAGPSWAEVVPTPNVNVSVDVCEGWDEVGLSFVASWFCPRVFRNDPSGSQDAFPKTSDFRSAER